MEASEARGRFAVDCATTALRRARGWYKKSVGVWRGATGRDKESRRNHCAASDAASNQQTSMESIARLATVGRLAASAVHEISNPLLAASAGIECARDCIESGRASHAVEILLDVQDALERASTIVRDVSSASRPRAEVDEDVDVHGVLEGAWRLARLARKADDVVLVRAYGEIPFVRGSRSRLGQVFVNLFVNAIEAGSAIRPDATVCVRTALDENQGAVIIDVVDTGVGIPLHMEGKLFTPFVTTKAEGTGIGLAVCRDVMRAMGGDVLLLRRSSQAGGATFRVVMPLVRGG